MRFKGRASLIITLAGVIALVSCSGNKHDKTIKTNDFSGYSQVVDTFNRGIVDLHVRLNNLIKSNDTILSFRRSQGIDSTRLIICNPKFSDQRCEDVIWNNEYVIRTVNGLKEMNLIAVIDFEQINETNVVGHLSMLDMQKHLVLRLRSFQLKKYRIVKISYPSSNELQSIEKIKYEEEHPWDNTTID